MKARARTGSLLFEDGSFAVTRHRAHRPGGDGETAAIGREAHAGSPRRCGRQLAHQIARVRFPETDDAIVAAGRQQLAVRREAIACKPAREHAIGAAACRRGAARTCTMPVFVAVIRLPSRAKTRQRTSSIGRRSFGWPSRGPDANGMIMARGGEKTSFPPHSGNTSGDHDCFLALLLAQSPLSARTGRRPAAGRRSRSPRDRRAGSTAAPSFSLAFRREWTSSRLREP